MWECSDQATSAAHSSKGISHKRRSAIMRGKERALGMQQSGRAASSTDGWQTVDRSTDDIQLCRQGIEQGLNGCLGHLMLERLLDIAGLALQLDQAKGSG